MLRGLMEMIGIRQRVRRLGLGSGPFRRLEREEKRMVEGLMARGSGRYAWVKSCWVL